MVLSYLWISFFLIGFVVAVIKLCLGDVMIFKTMVDGIFETANTGVTISIGLVGTMSLFLGLMQIGERAGAVNLLSRIVGPFFNKLFPGVPRNHPAMGHMMMNFSANMLQLDNAATPFGLKAMASLQELNPQKDTATDAQIMFMVLHASGLSLIPVTVIAQRVAKGSANPTDIFIPCVIATFAATMVGMVLTAFRQRFSFRQWKAIILFGLSVSLCLAGMAVFLRNLSPTNADRFSTLLSTILIMLLFITFILGGLYKKIPVFDTFIEGAKQGFEVAIKIIPYLVGLLVAISILRTSGVFDYIVQGAQWFFAKLGINTDFVPALPTALMRPFSGGASRAMMLQMMDKSMGPIYGPDTFVGRLACMFQGSSETTFYVVALYFGSVNITKTRYAIPTSLLADLAGVVTAIIVAYNWPWGN